MKKLEEDEKSDIEDESHPLHMELIESSSKDDELDWSNASLPKKNLMIPLCSRRGNNRVNGHNKMKS